MAAAGRWVGVKSGVYCAAHHSEAVGSCLVKRQFIKMCKAKIKKTQGDFQ